MLIYWHTAARKINTASTDMAFNNNMLVCQWLAVAEATTMWNFQYGSLYSDQMLSNRTNIGKTVLYFTNTFSDNLLSRQHCKFCVSISEGQLKMQETKMQHNQKCKGGKCRTVKCGTEMQEWKVQKKQTWDANQHT